MTTQTPATAEIDSQIFDSGTGSGSETKTLNPVGVDSGTPDPVPPLMHGRRFKVSLAWSFPSPCFGRLCLHAAVALA